MKKTTIAGCIAAAAFCALILSKVLNKEPFAEAVLAPVVEVTTPERRDISITAGLVGSVEPEDVVYLYPKASGDVTQVNIQAGDVVEAGQLICVVDTKQIESAKSALDSASLALKQANEEFSRQSVLYAAGGISEQEYTQYKDNVESAQIAYESARTDYDNQVSYSQITAPISGVVETCNLQLYDQVSQSDMICVISGHGDRIVSFSVTERIKKNLEVGDRITVEKDDQTFEGTIYEVSSMADSSTGLFYIKARLDEADLSTGTTVKLYVVSDSAEDVMTIPVDSVYYEGGLSYVYTYDGETGTIHKVQIETGLYDSDWIEVKSGLEEDEQVLTTWSSELYEGTEVRLKESQQS